MGTMDGTPIDELDCSLEQSLKVTTKSNVESSTSEGIFAVNSEQYSRRRHPDESGLPFVLGSPAR
jgi:hypothetical protein